MGKRVKAVLPPAFDKPLFAVKQVFRDHNNDPVDVCYAEDKDTGIPFLYDKSECDPGQLEYGMETYIPVRVRITPIQKQRSRSKRK